MEREGMLRQRDAPLPDGTLSFCSNDYLGLASTMAQPARSGAGASRLLGGDRIEHVDLESALTGWLGLATALVFSSGYAANLGTLGALAGPGDLIVSDELNHASIIDGVRLSRARVIVIPHLRTEAVETALAGRREAKAIVVTESYFSMDADSPDLRNLRALCDAYDALLVVDEAHALGVLGPSGTGLCAEANVEADAVVGTLGKALGAGGAFVAGHPLVTQWLWNRARAFVFSTGLSPVVARAALANLRIAQSRPELRETALAMAAVFRAGLREIGIEPLGYGHIIPVPVGDVVRALSIAAGLRGCGIHALAVRPPTVPPGTSRIRFTVTAHTTESVIERALAAITTLFR
jgi:8-amino-7-oxononanoate synthase